jgi:hypothetical protein
MIKDGVSFTDLGDRRLNLVRCTRFDDVIRTDVGQPIGLRGRSRRPDRTRTESLDELDASNPDAAGCSRDEHEIIRPDIGSSKHMIGGHVRGRERCCVSEIYRVRECDEPVGLDTCLFCKAAVVQAELFAEVLGPLTTVPTDPARFIGTQHHSIAWGNRVDICPCLRDLSGHVETTHEREVIRIHHCRVSFEDPEVVTVD